MSSLPPSPSPVNGIVHGVRDPKNLASEDGGSESSAIPQVGASSQGVRAITTAPTFVPAGAPNHGSYSSFEGLSGPCLYCPEARPLKRERAQAPEALREVPLLCPGCGRPLSPI